MQFVSLEPLDEGRPIVEILTNGVSYDLHNDAILDRSRLSSKQESCGFAGRRSSCMADPR